MTAPFGSDEELAEMQDCADVAAERTRLREALERIEQQMVHSVGRDDGCSACIARAALALPAPAPSADPDILPVATMLHCCPDCNVAHWTRDPKKDEQHGDECICGECGYGL